MNPCIVPTIPYDGDNDEWKKQVGNQIKTKIGSFIIQDNFFFFNPYKYSLILQHERYVAEAKHRDPNVILIGASIIQFIQCFPIWKNKFELLNSLNFGIAGDQVQNVLWRVTNGILDHIRPKVIILFNPFIKSTN